MSTMKLMRESADSVRVAHPLFQVEGGGSIPTSALQLLIVEMETREAVRLNREWHSRLPLLTNWQQCFAFGALFEDIYYAVAIWGPPIARMLNNRDWLELRRMAIADDAPKNTASRMLAVMTRLISRRNPSTKRLISYQDTSAHTGTIYKAAGWKVGARSGNITTGWNSRLRNKMQTTADKIRWEKDLKICPAKDVCDKLTVRNDK